MDELTRHARRRRAPSLARHPARPAPRSPAPQQGLRYPADPPCVEEIVAVMRCRRRQTARPADPRPGRAAVAGRAPQQRGARARPKRPRRRARGRPGAAGQGRQAPRGRHGPLGLAAPRALAGTPASAAHRRAALRHQRSNRGAALVSRSGPRDAPAARRHRRRATTLRAAPTAPRPRRRDGREGVPLNVIQRQLGHANLGVTSVYLQGIDNSEIIDTVHARPAPTLPASAKLRSR